MPSSVERVGSRSTQPKKYTKQKKETVRSSVFLVPFTIAINCVFFLSTDSWDFIFFSFRQVCFVFKDVVSQELLQSQMDLFANSFQKGPLHSWCILLCWENVNVPCLSFFWYFIHFKFDDFVSQYSQCPQVVPLTSINTMLSSEPAMIYFTCWMTRWNSFSLLLTSRIFFFFFYRAWRRTTTSSMTSSLLENLYRTITKNRFTASPNSFDDKSIVCKYSHFCDVYSWRTDSVAAVRLPLGFHSHLQTYFSTSVVQYVLHNAWLRDAVMQTCRRRCCCERWMRRLFLATIMISPSAKNSLIWKNLFENSRICSLEKTKKWNGKRGLFEPELLQVTLPSVVRLRRGCADEWTLRWDLSPQGPAHSINGAVYTCRYVCTLCQSD